jgi:hypothetical protein
MLGSGTAEEGRFWRGVGAHAARSMTEAKAAVRSMALLQDRVRRVRYEECQALPLPHSRGERMAVKFRTTGCMASIVLSVVLTVVLNLLLRGCTT